MSVTEYEDIHLPDDHPLCAAVVWAQSQRQMAFASVEGARKRLQMSQDDLAIATVSLERIDATVRALHAAVGPEAAS